MQQRQRHDPSKSLVGFLVGDVRYAVPISAVKEIANPAAVTELPRAPFAVVGVADFRGDLVPIVDLRACFGLPPAPRTRKTKWIVVDVAGRIAAIVVDAVTEVFGTGGADLRRAPSLGGGEDARGIAGVTRYGGTHIFVLDTARLRELTDAVASAGAGPPELHSTFSPPQGPS